MYNILLAGVGGQGTVLASKMIAACAIARGESAHTAETIGMAQRGGSVVSHVRIGDEFCSPLIPHGYADVIIGFEPAEALRALPYLRRGGTVIVGNTAIKPTTDSLSESNYDGTKTIECIKTDCDNVFVVDGERVTNTLGSAKYLNVALLGAASQCADISCTPDELKSVVENMLKPQFKEINLKALKLGADCII